MSSPKNNAATLLQTLIPISNSQSSDAKNIAIAIVDAHLATRAEVKPGDALAKLDQKQADGIAPTEAEFKAASKQALQVATKLNLAERLKPFVEYADKVIEGEVWASEASDAVTQLGMGFEEKNMLTVGMEMLPASTVLIIMAAFKPDLFNWLAPKVTALGEVLAVFINLQLLAARTLTLKYEDAAPQSLGYASVAFGILCSALFARGKCRNNNGQAHEQKESYTKDAIDGVLLASIAENIISLIIGITNTNCAISSEANSFFCHKIKPIFTIAVGAGCGFWTFLLRHPSRREAVTAFFKNAGNVITGAFSRCCSRHRNIDDEAAEDINYVEVSPETRAKIASDEFKKETTSGTLATIDTAFGCFCETLLGKVRAKGDDVADWVIAAFDAGQYAMMTQAGLKLVYTLYSCYCLKKELNQIEELEKQESAKISATAHSGV